jgi:AraC-like DNA-binding protein
MNAKQQHAAAALPEVHSVVHVEGESNNKPGQFLECVHDEHVIACHIRAHGDYIAGSEVQTGLRGPYMGILPAGERDANGLLGHFRMVWCKFFWSELHSETGERVSLKLGDARVHRSHTRMLSSGELPRVTGLFRELQTLSRRSDLPSRLQASARVLELMACWAEAPAETGGDERAVRLYRNLIEQHAEQSEVPLSALAERVGYTPDHLGELFHKDLGLTPVAYRTQVRLQRARDLLKATPMPISEVARDAGFPDANYFSRIFRRSFGVSPRDFAKRRFTS